MRDYYYTPSNRLQWEALGNGMVDVFKDGVFKATCPDANEAFKYIFDHVSSSVAFATAYEGWTVKDHEERIGLK